MMMTLLMMMMVMMLLLMMILMMVVMIVVVVLIATMKAAQFVASVGGSGRTELSICSREALGPSRNMSHP